MTWKFFSCFWKLCQPKNVFTYILNFFFIETFALLKINCAGNNFHNSFEFFLAYVEQSLYLYKALILYTFLYSQVFLVMRPNQFICESQLL